MTRLAFAIGLLALGTAAIPARADFAVVEFRSGYCRIWDQTIFGPQDGRYLHFPHPWSWHWRFHTLEGANMAMHWAVAHHRCSLVIVLDKAKTRPAGAAAGSFNLPSCALNRAVL